MALAVTGMMPYIGLVQRGLWPQEPLVPWLLWPQTSLDQWSREVWSHSELVLCGGNSALLLIDLCGPWSVSKRLCVDTPPLLFSASILLCPRSRHHSAQHPLLLLGPAIGRVSAANIISSWRTPLLAVLYTTSPVPFCIQQRMLGSTRFSITLSWLGLLPPSGPTTTISGSVTAYEEISVSIMWRFK